MGMAFQGQGQQVASAESGNVVWCRALRPEGSRNKTDKVLYLTVLLGRGVRGKGGRKLADPPAKRKLLKLFCHTPHTHTFPCCVLWVREGQAVGRKTFWALGAC